MKKNLIGKLITVVLIIIMGINAFMLIRLRMVLNTDAVLRENKASYTFPDGFTPEGLKISQDESSVPASGWVVRYASKGCVYCMLDFEWEWLVPQLEQRNYRSIVLLPKEEDRFDEDRIVPRTAQQMAFVKMDWLKQFRFTGTPTVIIFDNKGHVLWSHYGILKEADYKSAEKTIAENVK